MLAVFKNVISWNYMEGLATKVAYAGILLVLQLWKDLPWKSSNETFRHMLYCFLLLLNFKERLGTLSYGMLLSKISGMLSLNVSALVSSLLINNLGIVGIETVHGFHHLKKNAITQ